ncbi:MAG: hypothetical protein KDB07_08910 [Planctomycetes bacterium]|nr:hypothetical protein [Planctomycetota bacterium]
MSKENQDKKKENKKGGEFVIRFSKGDIGASVFLKTASAGFRYLSYSLSRSYEVGEKKEKRYSSDFYDYNAASIADVVIRASKFIGEHRDNPEGAIEGAKVVKANRDKYFEGKKQAKANGVAKEADAPAEAASF